MGLSSWQLPQHTLFSVSREAREAREERIRLNNMVRQADYSTLLSAEQSYLYMLLGAHWKIVGLVANQLELGKNIIGSVFYIFSKSH